LSLYGYSNVFHLKGEYVRDCELTDHVLWNHRVCENVCGAYL